MKKKSVFYILLIITILFALPISVSAKKISQSDTEESYSLKSISANCTKEAWPQSGSKCDFKATIGKRADKVELGLYSDKNMKNRVGGFVESSSFDYGQSLGNPIDALERATNKTFTYYLKVLTYESTKVWDYSYHYKVTYTIGSSVDNYSTKMELLGVYNNDNAAIASITPGQKMDDLLIDSTETPSQIIDRKCDKPLKDLIEKYWSWVMFLAPLLLIVMMSIDFIKATTSGDADAINKSASNAIKRVIATVILLALPWFLNTVFNMFGLKICF